MVSLEPWNNPGDDTVTVQYSRAGETVEGPDGADGAHLWEGPAWALTCVAALRHVPDLNAWIVVRADVEIPDHYTFPGVAAGLDFARAWRARARDKRFRTADHTPIVDGLRVWTYDLEPGTVDFALSGVDGPAFGDLPAFWQNWFTVRTDDGGRKLMDGSRLRTVHPMTRKPVPPAPGTPGPVSRANAERVRVIVADYYGVPLYGPDGRPLGCRDGVPELFPPGHQDSGWAVVWQGDPAPYDWPFTACEGRPRPDTRRIRKSWPVGVFTEAVTPWILGVYPPVTR